LSYELVLNEQTETDRRTGITRNVVY